MTQSDDARRESGALRAPATTLNAAIGRINATLDLDTVLGEAVASARSLTGARYGVIVAVDEEGATHDPVFSGLTPGQEQEQLACPGNARLFEHLRTLPGPVRAVDFPGYVRALGIDAAWTISRTFQGAPMRHRGVDVGHFFLAEKADGEAFTDEDEEVLALFASQAASAIAAAATAWGWRAAFMAQAGVTAAIALGFFLAVRDAPGTGTRGHGPDAARESLSSVIAGPLPPGSRAAARCGAKGTRRWRRRAACRRSSAASPDHRRRLAVGPWLHGGQLTRGLGYGGFQAIAAQNLDELGGGSGAGMLMERLAAGDGVVSGRCMDG